MYWRVSGTGAIMAVPAGDDRDHAFAKHFNIPITNIFGDKYDGEAAVSDKNVTIENSEFISGLTVKDAAAKVLDILEEKEPVSGRSITVCGMRDSAASVIGVSLSRLPIRTTYLMR